MPVPNDKILAASPVDVTPDGNKPLDCFEGSYFLRRAHGDGYVAKAVAEWERRVALRATGGERCLVVDHAR